MRKIAVVTGTRAEYGYLKPLMNAVEKNKDLTLIPIITGMHLLSKYGSTYRIVENDFPTSVKIPMILNGDSLRDMADYLSSGLKNITSYLYENSPDILVVLGDRSESLAAALSALFLNIPILHINGGDVTGTTIDESIRHAITKIAHIHCVHTNLNAKRIEKMGEEKKRIYVTGALTIDTIKNSKLIPKNEIFKKYDLNPKKPTFLVVQHPVTTLKDRGFSQIRELFFTLDELKKQTIVLYPNCDAGSKNFIDLIEKYRNKKYFYVIKNLPHEDYLSIMSSIDLMIGNSSSGIIESPSFKIPVVNLGSRQCGREKSENIVDVKPHKKDILRAIDYALNNENFTRNLRKCKNKFGDGKASEKIVKILNNLKINDCLIQKQITY